MKWISIVILGLAILSLATVGALFVMDQPQNKSNSSNDADNRQNISKQEAKDAVRETTSYEILQNSTNQALGLNSVKLTQSEINTVQSGTRPEEMSRIIYALLNSELVKLKPGFLVETESNPRSGYFYQVNNQGEVISTWGVEKHQKALDSSGYSGTVQELECSSSASGFGRGDIRVPDFGVTSQGNLALELRNGASNSIEIKSITISTGDDTISYDGTSREIKVGAISTFIVEGTVEETVLCNSLDVDVVYDIDWGASNKTISGIITGNVDINSF